MRRHISLACAAAISILLFAAVARNATDDRRDGTWWRELTRVQKTNYMVGFFDGMVLGNSFSYWGILDNDKNDAAIGKVAGSYHSYNDKYFSHVTNLQLVDGLEYQEHPEAKSLAPDGRPCEAGTSGLLQRAHVIAGEFRYVGKETDRKWEGGDDISVLDFKTTEYGRAKMIVAHPSIAAEIRAIGIPKTMNLTKSSQHTIEKLVRGSL